MIKNALGVSVLAVATAACAASGGDDDRAKGETSALASTLEGTYDFSLDDSDVAARVRARCNDESPTDAARAASCFDSVREEAKLEKIRFSRGPRGELVYTSFAVEGGKEEIFVEVPITLAPRDAAGAYVAKAAGFPSGSWVGRIKHINAKVQLELHEGGSLTLVDPDKGRLVYTRSR